MLIGVWLSGWAPDPLVHILKTHVLFLFFLFFSLSSLTSSALITHLAQEGVTFSSSGIFFFPTGTNRFVCLAFECQV